MKTPLISMSASEHLNYEVCSWNAGYIGIEPMQALYSSMSAWVSSAVIHTADYLVHIAGIFVNNAWRCAWEV